MSQSKEITKSMLRNRGLIMQDTENNTFVEIVSSNYIVCINRRIKKGQTIVPEYYEISDECLEFIADHGIKTVTWNGMILNAMSALDLSLKDVLEDEGFIFEYNREIVNPYQQIMFEDLN